MAAVYTSMQQHPNCCTNSAAATTSARLYAIVDTVIAAVSIIILHLLSLLVLQS